MYIYMYGFNALKMPEFLLIETSRETSRESCRSPKSGPVELSAQVHTETLIDTVKFTPPAGKGGRGGSRVLWARLRPDAASGGADGEGGGGDGDGGGGDGGYLKRLPQSVQSVPKAH